MLEKLHNASNDYKEDERLIALKDKFVDMNNVSNWVIETVYANPNADMYKYFVHKSQKYRRFKRQKNDSKEI